MPVVSEPYPLPNSIFAGRRMPVVIPAARGTNLELYRYIGIGRSAEISRLDKRRYGICIRLSDFAFD